MLEPALQQQQLLGVLEIKCPSSCKDKPIYVEYLDFLGRLKKTHTYYTQVQIQMYVTGLQLAHLFVYSSKDYKLVSIPFDEAFLKATIPHLEQLYFKECLPTLV